MKHQNNKKIISITLISLISVYLISCSSTTKPLVKTDDSTEFSVSAVNEYAFSTVDPAIDSDIYIEEIREANHPYASITLDPTADIEIVSNNNFLTKINAIRQNVVDFEKTMVTIEGMYGIYHSWDDTFVYPMVYRSGPGCHLDDDYDGFFLINIDKDQFLENDWVRISGTPFMYEHTDSLGEVQKFLFLVALDSKKMSLKDRKAEMVNN